MVDVLSPLPPPPPPPLLRFNIARCIIVCELSFIIYCSDLSFIINRSCRSTRLLMIFATRDLIIYVVQDMKNTPFPPKKNLLGSRLFNISENPQNCCWEPYLTQD